VALFAGSRVLPEREVPLGGLRSMMVRRTLPHRELPTVGAWCFVDHFGPERTSMNVLPHPHTGLQTVTWPFAGRIRHRDSLGNDVMLRPGELNLMTSGNGVAHSEVSLDDAQLLHGLQLWVALPDSARNGPATFDHHALLPSIERDKLKATILVGEFLGSKSSAATHSPLVAVELRLAAGVADLPLKAEFEHALMLVDGTVAVEGSPVDRGPLLYLPPGATSLQVSSSLGAHLVLLGGEPFDEELVMWWNFIGRSHDEIVQARDQWESGDARFGHVAGHADERIPAPALPGVRLRPRKRR